MSDDECGDASYTYSVSAASIRRNGYIVIEGRPCKVYEISTSEEHGHANFHFVGVDIFTGKELEMTVPSSDNCDFPYVTQTEYTLIDISEDGFVSLMPENGSPRDDMKQITDEELLNALKDKFAEATTVVVSVMSAMGEEQIVSYKFT